QRPLPEQVESHVSEDRPRLRGVHTEPLLVNGTRSKAPPACEQQDANSREHEYARPTRALPNHYHEDSDNCDREYRSACIRVVEGWNGNTHQYDRGQFQRTRPSVYQNCEGECYACSEVGAELERTRESRNCTTDIAVDNVLIPQIPSGQAVDDA